MRLGMNKMSMIDDIQLSVHDRKLELAVLSQNGIFKCYTSSLGKESADVLKNFPDIRRAFPYISSTVVTPRFCSNMARNHSCNVGSILNRCLSMRLSGL